MEVMDVSLALFGCLGRNSRFVGLRVGTLFGWGRGRLFGVREEIAGSVVGFVCLRYTVL